MTKSFGDGEIVTNKKWASFIRTPYKSVRPYQDLITAFGIFLMVEAS